MGDEPRGQWSTGVSLCAEPIRRSTPHTTGSWGSLHIAAEQDPPGAQQQQQQSGQSGRRGNDDDNDNDNNSGSSGGGAGSCGGLGRVCVNWRAGDFRRAAFPLAAARCGLSRTDAATLGTSLALAASLLLWGGVASAGGWPYAWALPAAACEALCIAWAKEAFHASGGRFSSHLLRRLFQLCRRRSRNGVGTERSVANPICLLLFHHVVFFHAVDHSRRSDGNTLDNPVLVHDKHTRLAGCGRLG